MPDAQMSTYTELAGRFAKAAEARDADQLIGLYHPDARFWNNVRQHVSTTADIVEITRLEAKVIAEYIFENVRITATSEGFVLQMTVTGSTNSGATFAVETCLVAKVTDNLISQIDEYVDATQAAPIFAELLSSFSTETP
jgi:ketosteroid isomerase-like protein